MKKRIVCFLSALLLAVSLASPVLAYSEPAYVFDEAGLLTAAQQTQLETMARQTAEKYRCGIYIITVDDHRNYGSDDVYTVTYSLYHSNSLGVGPERNGVTLLLSMAQRDFATFFYGDFTEYAFNDYGQEKLEEVFLDDFRENRWYEGFSDYIAESSEYLAKAEAGHPVRRNVLSVFLLAALIACPISAVICVAVRSSTMKTTRRAARADVYARSGLRLSEQWDRFTRTEVRTRKIETKSSSGSGSSTARSGGGGSGRSGKF